MVQGKYFEHRTVQDFNLQDEKHIDFDLMCRALNSRDMPIYSELL